MTTGRASWDVVTLASVLSTLCRGRVSEPLSAYMTTRDIAAYLGVKPSTGTAYVAWLSPSPEGITYIG